MKNSNDIIGNRTRDLPACSAVPQPTAPPRAPIFVSLLHKFKRVDFVWLLHFMGKCYVSSTAAQKYGELLGARYVLCDRHCASRRLLDERPRFRSPCDTDLQKLSSTVV